MFLFRMNKNSAKVKINNRLTSNISIYCAELRIASILQHTLSAYL